MTPDLQKPSSTQNKGGRWRSLVILAWLVTGGAAVQIVVARLWNDSLQDASGGMLTLHLAAFMAQVFAFHAGLVMLGVLAFSVVARRWALAVTAATVFALGAGPDVCRAISAPKPAFIPPGRGLKVMSINTMMGELDAERTLRQIRDEDPDIIEFQEWTDLARHKLLSKLREKWPNVVEAVQNDPFGQATFSKRAFVEPPVTQLPGHPWEPSICVAVDSGGRTLHLRNVHLLPPMRRSLFGEQRAMARTFAEKARTVEAGDVLAGDFNATLGTGVLGAFEQRGWQDAQRLAGHGRGATWCRLGWVSFFPGVAIDHVLVTRGVRVLACRTGQDTGSDHRPIIAVVD